MPDTMITVIMNTPMSMASPTLAVNDDDDDDRPHDDGAQIKHGWLVSQSVSRSVACSLGAWLVGGCLLVGRSVSWLMVAQWVVRYCWLVGLGCLVSKQVQHTCLQSPTMRLLHQLPYSMSDSTGLALATAANNDAAFALIHCTYARWTCRQRRNSTNCAITHLHIGSRLQQGRLRPDSRCMSGGRLCGGADGLPVLSHWRLRGDLKRVRRQSPDYAVVAHARVDR